MNFLKVSLVMLLLTLVGCATTIVNDVPGPDGSLHFSITCRNMASCYKRAHEVCGGPYTIIDRSTQVSSGGDAFVRTSQGLLIKCNSLGT